MIVIENLMMDLPPLLNVNSMYSVCTSIMIDFIKDIPCARLAQSDRASDSYIRRAHLKAASSTLAVG
jgi:hypothetical protein